jgi:hypothetical protein
MAMNLILQLTPETESQLKEWTALTGKKPETVALEALQEKLSGEDPQVRHADPLVEFQKWYAAHPASEATTVDDSRETIYEGRGE